MLLRGIANRLINALSIGSAFITLSFAPLQAQTIDPPVKIGLEVRVHESTSYQQWWHSNRMITVLRDGSYLFVWQADNRGEAGSDVYAQRFTADHQKTGEFRVNATIEGSQQSPIAAPLKDGGYVIAWQSTSVDGTGLNILARRYSADGVAGPEFMVNQTTAGDQWFPTISALGDGFVVVWMNNPPGASEYNAIGRRFDGTGTGGLEFQINSVPGDLGITPAVASLTDDGFVVTWAQNIGQTSFVIKARRYDAIGMPGDEFAVSEEVAAYRNSPRVAGLTGGGYVISWGYQTGAIHARLYPASGAPAAHFIANSNFSGPPEFSNFPQTADMSQIVATRDGGFMISWHGGTDVHARRFSSTGAPLHDDVKLNTYEPDYQEWVAVGILSSHEFVAGWNSRNQDGLPGWGLYTQVFRYGTGPIARDDVATVGAGKSVSVNVLANDHDPGPGSTLSVTSASAALGTVQVNIDGTITYSAPSGCTSKYDTITYAIRDTSGRTDEAKVYVTVSGGGEPIMSVNAPSPLKVRGPVGGPFPSLGLQYTVKNVGCGPLNWVAGRRVNWMAVTPASGVLDTDESVTVTVELNSNASMLAAGLHRASMRFSNRVNGNGDVLRGFQLFAEDTWGADDLALSSMIQGVHGIVYANNVDASASMGEPNHAGVSGPSKSVWWTWTAPQTGWVILSTKLSSFDTALAIYTGDTLSSLSQVAANDDSGPGLTWSRVQFRAQAGTTYRIAVDGKGGASGMIRLRYAMPEFISSRLRAEIESEE